jgi:Flp pilus assembly protein TadG
MANMRTNHQAVLSRKGFVSVYLAFSSFLLIPMAGLAIDFSVLYSVKARLQTAVDAAAIGSGNTLNRGSVMDTTAVRDVALRFFNANYPAGYFGSSPVTYNATPVQGALGVRTITINASQHVPMLFMRVLGISQSTVAATAQVTVRFVNMMIVVDRSGSVFRATFNGTPTRQIVDDSLHQFVDPVDGSQSPYFSDGRDNIGMVTLHSPYLSASNPPPPTLEPQSITSIGIPTTARIRPKACSTATGNSRNWPSLAPST